MLSGAHRGEVMGGGVKENWRHTPQELEDLKEGQRTIKKEVQALKRSAEREGGVRGRVF